MHLRVLGVLTALEQGDLWPSASQAWKGGAVGTWDPKRCVVLQLPFYRRSGKSKLPPQFQGIPPLRSAQPGCRRPGAPLLVGSLCQGAPTVPSPPGGGLATSCGCALCTETLVFSALGILLMRSLPCHLYVG